MYTKTENLAQKQNSRERSPKTVSPIAVGDAKQCPECRAMGHVVWVSEDKKTVGVQCSASHREVAKPKSKYGATSIPSTKTTKNVVFLMAIS